MVCEDDTGLFRLQCKTGRVIGNVINFQTCSQTGNVRKHYRGDVDVFGVYCPARNEVYLVPIDGMPATNVYLRLEPTKSGQKRGVRWARDYLLASGISPRLFEPEDFVVEPAE
jgi:hypothetical protein